MVSMSDVIGFLWNLMRNDEARSHFEQNPHAALNECGLGGVTASDIRDAQMVMQDRGLAHPSAGGPTSGGHDNPVDEIRHTSTTYEIDRSMTIDNNQTFTVVDINETNVSDSFNSGDSTTEVTAIQDNDTTTNNVDVTAIDDSFNEDSSAPDTADDSDQSTADTSDTAADPDADDDTVADPDADTAADPDADDASVHTDEDTADDSEADTSVHAVDEDSEFHTLPDVEPVTDDAEVVASYAGEELDAPVG